MHALALYLDTSVIGGYFDAEFMADTRALWRHKEAGRFRFVSSQLVIDEVADAPERVRELMRTSFTPEDALDVSVEMEDLAAVYMAQQIVPTGFADDAQHVAVCSVARIDFLVSWNFKHLANARRSRLQCGESLARLPGCAHRSSNLPYPWPRRKRDLTRWRSPGAGASKPANAWQR